jgi:hypothetical protein
MEFLKVGKVLSYFYFKDLNFKGYLQVYNGAKKII